MKRWLSQFLVVALGISGCSLILGQTAPQKGPVAFTFVSNGTVAVSGLNGQSYCTTTVASTSTMGGGTITMNTSADNGNNYFAVSGVPDLGSGSGASQTISSAGTQLTAPVGGKTNFELVLAGSTSPSITGTILCGSGTGIVAAGAGSGTSVVTCSSPACVVTTPAPAATCTPDNGICVHDNNVMWRGSGGVLVSQQTIGCNNSFTWATTGPGTITAQNLTSGDSIYVCGWVLSSTAGTTTIASGTTNACTSTTVLYSSIAGVSSNFSSATWAGLGGTKPLLGAALCIVLGTGTTGATGTIYYTIASPGP